EEPQDTAHGLEVGYRQWTINGKCLGYGEPLRVREGQRVLFHFLNASATEDIELALPGHEFEVVALDGNPVPNPRSAGVLQLGVSERIDAIVTMDRPGVWILGALNERARNRGLGIVVEYANRGGKPQWVQPAKSNWDYAWFGSGYSSSQPDETIPLVFRQELAGADGVEQWSIHGALGGGAPRQRSQGVHCRVIFHQQHKTTH